MRPTTCVHFGGIQNATCRAGVAYLSVRDTSGPGLYRWPCLTITDLGAAATACAKKQLPTPEMIAEDERELAAMEERVRADLAEGRCVRCHRSATSLRQEGACVYANPCGHRQGQGDARRMGPPPQPKRSKP